MFEKEAEFYAREKYSPKTDSFIVAVADDAFKDGAEFGYKKCQEEMQKNGLALQFDMDRTIEQNMALKAQIEKMRNFENCDYQLHITDCPIFKSGGHISCKKCPHWTLQEIKEK